MTFILTMVIFIITANESQSVYEQSPLSIYDLKPHPLMVKKNQKEKHLEMKIMWLKIIIHSFSMY